MSEKELNQNQERARLDHVIQDSVSNNNNLSSMDRFIIAGTWTGYGFLFAKELIKIKGVKLFPAEFNFDSLLLLMSLTGVLCLIASVYAVWKNMDCASRSSWSRVRFEIEGNEDDAIENWNESFQEGSRWDKLFRVGLKTSIGLLIASFLLAISQH